MDIDFIRQFRDVIRRLERELYFQNSLSCCGGVTLAQCHTLLEIENKKQISVSELANNLYLDKSTVSRTVDGLVNIGLVDRNIPSENRRKALLSLTKAGEKASHTIHFNNDKYFNDTLNILADEEQQQLLKLLQKMTNNMQELRKNCCNSNNDTK